MKKIKIIFMSFLIIVFCVSIISGATYALFTSRKTVNIAVTSGTVKVVATPSLVATYSIQASDEENYTIKVLKPESTTEYDYYTQPDTAELGTFTNDGSATVNENGDIVLDRMTPGDKAVFQIAITNQSNVSIKYRFKIEAANNEDVLLDALTVTIDLDGEKTNYSSHEYTKLISYGSASILVPAEQAIDSVVISIEMPAEIGNIYQTLETSFVLTVEAVQGNAADISESVTQHE